MVRRNVLDSGDDDDAIAMMIAIAHQRSMRKKQRHRRRGGSMPGKRANKKRDFRGRWDRFYHLYFSNEPVYSDEQFRRRFRMRRELFQRICDKVTQHDIYFQQKVDCTGKRGIHPIMKVIAAFRVLAYGCSADSLDENLEISETVVYECVKKFTKAVIECFGDQYLRAPTNEDIQELLEENAARGFPGMVGSLDCMKWKWQNCPTSWRGAYQGMAGKPTVVLEAVASYNLHIWHAFIGMPGASNDLNVLDASPLMSEYLDDEAPRYKYTVDGVEYDFTYWLADGIYPDWRCFVKTITAPIGEVEQHYAKAQEALRKDVERAFGVLQSRFAIVARPVKFWSLATICQVMKCCIILHNLIVDDDKHSGRAVSYSSFQCKHGRSSEAHIAHFSRLENYDGLSFMEKYKEVQSSADHFRLKRSLMKHLWEKS